MSWQSPDPYRQGEPYPSHSPAFRDPLDAMRSGDIPRTPEAQYPSGYLNPPRSGLRTGDDRSYDRGVHRGSKLPSEAYLWPAEWNPLRGLESQAQGLKTVPLIGKEPQALTRMGKPGANRPTLRPTEMTPPWGY